MSIQIYRGTTPTIYCNLPDTINPAEIAEVWITLAHGKKYCLDFSLDAGTIDLVGRTLSIHLSQEQTLSLRPHSCELGVRILMKDSTALAIKQPVDVEVIDVTKDGVIYDAG